MNFHKIWEQKQSIKHPVSVVAEVTLFTNTTLKRTPLKHLKTKDAITLHKRFVVLWNSRHLSYGHKFSQQQQLYSQTYFQFSMLMEVSIL